MSLNSFVVLVLAKVKLNINKNGRHKPKMALQPYMIFLICQFVFKGRVMGV